jgi:hypothetical protein
MLESPDKTACSSTFDRSIGLFLCAETAGDRSLLPVVSARGDTINQLQSTPQSSVIDRFFRRYD